MVILFCLMINTYQSYVRWQAKASELILLVNGGYVAVVCTETQNHPKPVKGVLNKAFKRIKHDCMFQAPNRYELLNNLKY